jgi:hypothetical protein
MTKAERKQIADELRAAVAEAENVTELKGNGSPAFQIGYLTQSIEIIADTIEVGRFPEKG